MMVNMRRVAIYGACSAIAGICLFPMKGSAQMPEIELGKQVLAHVSLCASREVAETVAKTEQDGSLREAVQIFQLSEACASGTVHIIPMKVLSTWKTGRGDMKVIECLVAMEDGSKSTVYMFSTLSVKGYFDT